MSVGHSRRDEAEALAAPLGLVGQQLLQVALDAVLDQMARPPARPCRG